MIRAVLAGVVLSLAACQVTERPVPVATDSPDMATAKSQPQPAASPAAETADMSPSPDMTPPPDPIVQPPVLPDPPQGYANCLPSNPDGAWNTMAYPACGQMYTTTPDRLSPVPGYWCAAFGSQCRVDGDCYDFGQYPTCVKRNSADVWGICCHGGVCHQKADGSYY